MQTNKISITLLLALSSLSITSLYIDSNFIFFSALFFTLVLLSAAIINTFYSVITFITKKDTIKFLNNLRHLFISITISTIFLIYKPILLGFDIYMVMERSMLPVLNPGDIILVNTRKHEFTKRDIVVFSAPDRPKTVYIKRIEGIPNSKLFVSPNKVVEVQSGNTTKYQYNISIPNEHYFLLGDNLNYSRDSRHFGAVRHSNLFGKAHLVLIRRNEKTRNFNLLFKSIK